MIDSLPIVHIVDAVIAFTLLEGIALWLLHRATGRGVAPRDFALNVASGLALMAALRCLAAGAAPHWMLLCLLLAGLAHGSDILRRWHGRRPMHGQDEHKHKHKHKHDDNDNNHGDSRAASAAAARTFNKAAA